MPRAWHSWYAAVGRMHCVNRCRWWVTVDWAVDGGSCSNACSPNDTVCEREKIFKAINLLNWVQSFYYWSTSLLPTSNCPELSTHSSKVLSPNQYDFSANRIINYVNEQTIQPFFEDVLKWIQIDYLLAESNSILTKLIGIGVLRTWFCVGVFSFLARRFVTKF